MNVYLYEFTNFYKFEDLCGSWAFFSPTHSVFRKNLENLLEWPERSKPKLDDFLKRYGKGQDPKSGQMVVSECSSSTTEVEQTGDESNIPDAKTKNAERNKGKKGKKGKGKK